MFGGDHNQLSKVVELCNDLSATDPTMNAHLRVVVVGAATTPVAMSRAVVVAVVEPARSTTRIRKRSQGQVAPEYTKGVGALSSWYPSWINTESTGRGSSPTRR